jgi:hypothetical protein
MEREADDGRLSSADLLDEGLFRHLARNGRVAQGHSSYVGRRVRVVVTAAFGGMTIRTRSPLVRVRLRIS